jgi:hypothetical protein
MGEWQAGFDAYFQVPRIRARGSILPGVLPVISRGHGSRSSGGFNREAFR